MDIVIDGDYMLHSLVESCNKIFEKRLYAFLELSNDLHLIQSSPNFNTIHYAELIIKTAKQITIGNLSHFCSPANFVVRNKLILTTRINYILNYGTKKLLKKRCTLWAEFSLLALPLFFFSFVPEVSYRQIQSSAEADISEITKDNAFILKTETDYHVYVDGKYFATIHSIPKELKNIPLYMKGDYHEKE